MPKALITGIAGQTGSHLADYLLAEHPDWEVHGTTRYRSDLTNIKHILNKLHQHDCDLRDAHNVDKVIEKVKPDKVFHLAATSFVRSSFDQAAEVINNNVTSQVNVMEALLRHRKDAILQIACTSEEYGLVKPEETPIKETNPIRPLSPYGVSKVAQEKLGYQYNQSYGLKVIITRTFNHCGPRRGDAFVESSFCKQVAMIEAKMQEPIIYHGNLDSVRDYTDARDVVEAFWLATECCEPGVPYNICTGEAISIGKLLDDIASLSTVIVRKQPDPARMRPSDVLLLIGDSTKFRDKTGWKPRIPFKQTMSDLLEAWRDRLRK
jgi:GDP-4-dehydro-6-deoxy-D-mannose reductase